MQHPSEDSFPSYRSSDDRESIREAAANGRFDDLRSLISNRTWYITERFCGGNGMGGSSVDFIEGKIHDLWHIYFQFSRHVPYESSDQDKLVLDIVRIQGRGTLSRPSPGLDGAPSGFYGIDIARTRDGTLWDDLPFLARDMTAFWLDNCAPMGGEQRVNFASFSAKLASTRVSNDKICFIALLLFRKTFEDRGPSLVSPSDDMDNEQLRRTTSSLSIANLMPSVCAWIRETSRNLILLSEASWNECPRSIGEGGRLFLESEFGRRSPLGFTPWRLLFWLNRLYEIKDEAEEASETVIEQSATWAIQTMVMIMKEQNSKILKAYKVEHDRLKQAMHPSLLKGLCEER